MKEGLLSYLVCPQCSQPLRLTVEKQDREIEAGKFQCGNSHSFKITEFIPRFTDEVYTSNFGMQWRKFSKTQVDLYNGTKISKERFFNETRWDSAWMKGKKILDAGCGSGRFTQIAIEAGAEVFACDQSQAVDACRENFPASENLSIFQADLLQLPFPDRFFDAIFSLGVIQHTPSPQKTFLALVRHLKQGGRMAIDSYPYRWYQFLQPKYLLRSLLKAQPPERIFELCQKWLPPVLSFRNKFKRVPGLRPLIQKIFPIADYKEQFPMLTQEQAYEWMLLESCDSLAAYYDSPQSAHSLRQWFKEAGFTDLEIEDHGSLVARGVLCVG